MNIGDKVIYKTNGVCVVEGRCFEALPGSGASSFERIRQECYILRPLSDTGIKIYVPIDNEALTSQLHPILTPEQALDILHCPDSDSVEWIDDMRTRTNTFREQLSLGDRYLLFNMIASITHQRARLQKIGKKLYAVDEGMLKKAEKLLFEELAVVLEMAYDDVAQLFSEKFSAITAEV
jgi:CarD family transcriptional regulator